MSKEINEIGNVYNNLTVLRKAIRGIDYDIELKLKNTHTYWICQCKCGNITIKQGSELRNGKAISCGCIGKLKAQQSAKKLGDLNRHNLEGQRFGSLQVLYLYSINPATWACKCDCGSVKNIRGAYLETGHTTSCGCKIKNWQEGKKVSSQGEIKITQILNKNNIYFEREKMFTDLKGLRGTHLRFDFYILYNNTPILIEFQGSQHYQQTKFFHDNQSDFQKRQEYDRIKASYALSHNIKLYTIPFWELNNLSTINDLLQDKFLVKDKWHGDKMWYYYNNNIK